MERLILKGSRDTLLSSISQFLGEHLTTSLPDFWVLQYVYEELLTFLFYKSVNIDTIELCFESNFLNIRIVFESSFEDLISVYDETEKFLSQTGLNLLFNKYEIKNDKSLFFSYSLSYMEGDIIDKRQQLIQSYWKTSLKIKIHD